MRILLLKPPFNPQVFMRRFARCEPYEFAFLASAARDIAEISVADLRIDPRPLQTVLEDEKPDLVGFTALTMDVNTTLRLAAEVKAFSPDIVTCVGGEHSTFLPNDLLTDHMDYVFSYGSVDTFRSFVEALGRGEIPPSRIIRGIAAHREVDVQPDRTAYLKYWRRYVFGPAQPVSLFHSSFGCPYDCNFCSIVTKDPKFRTVRIDRALENLTACPATDVLSIDANALADLRFASEFYKELERARLGKRLMISCRSDTISANPGIADVLKKGGVSVVSMGLESIDDERLSSFNKDTSVADGASAVRILKAAGLLVRANFIISQDFTGADFVKLINAVKSMDIDFPVFQILTPLPGTPLFAETLSRWITTDFDYFDLSHSVLPTNMDFSEFHEQFRNLFRQTYSVRHAVRLSRSMPLMHSVRGSIAALRSFHEMRYNKAK